MKEKPQGPQLEQATHQGLECGAVGGISHTVFESSIIMFELA